jgi:hypothetical protein
MSADGQRIAATGTGTYLAAGPIVLSQDGGATWTTATGAGSRKWTGIAGSPDLSVITAAVQDDYIYTSTS